MEQIEKNENAQLLFDEKSISVIEQIAERMPGGFFIYRADGNEELIYVNQALLRIFGCDTEEEFRELTGNTFPGMVHSEDIDAVEESIRQQIASSRYDFDYVEYRIIQRDGSIRWVEDYGHFVHTPLYGDIFYVFIDDATERMRQRMKRLEVVNDELREVYEREIQYRKAILHDAIFFFEVNLTKDELIATTLPETEEEKALEQRVALIEAKTTSYSDYIREWEYRVMPDCIDGFRKFFDASRLIRSYERGGIEQTYDVWIRDSQGRKKLCHYIFLIGKNKYTGDIVALSVAKDITE